MIKKSTGFLYDRAFQSYTTLEPVFPAYIATWEIDTLSIYDKEFRMKNAKWSEEQTFDCDVETGQV